MIKRILGLNPTKEKNGKGYIPSRIGLLFGVDSKSGYTFSNFSNRIYKGSKKVLVLCTEEKYFEMKNNRLFSTGNNVQETAVPLMHITNAGFDFDVVTPTGSKAILEDWSFPKKDENVKEFMSKYKDKFSKPLSLEKLFKEGILNENSIYVAMFIPGGHGSMVGLPENENVGKLIRWIHDTNKLMVTVCHGPAALLAAKTNKSNSHPYKGYKMAIFPDQYDKQSPSLGYLPGHLPWYQCEELGKQGLEFVNTKIKGTVHIDRNLYSGDSPRACDELGKVVANQLLNTYL